MYSMDCRKSKKLKGDSRKCPAHEQIFTIL